MMTAPSSIAVHSGTSMRACDAIMTLPRTAKFPLMHQLANITTCAAFIVLETPLS